MKSNISKKWLVLRHGIDKYLYKNFEIFSPSSAGNPDILGFHTGKSITLTFPLLKQLLNNLKLNEKLIGAKEFCKQNGKINEASKLKYFFDLYGSDKSSIHNYHLVYGALFNDPKKIKAIFEIGLGTNNIDVLSNMGTSGKPGASVKALRDYFKNSYVYGADIDKRILFKDKRIKTYYTDQGHQNSIDKVLKKINKKFDLIIDDGLHAPYTNLNTLISSLKYLNKNGYLIIEDIPFRSQSIWEIVNFILNKKYKTNLIKTKNALIFLVKKK